MWAPYCIQEAKTFAVRLCQQHTGTAISSKWSPSRGKPGPGEGETSGGERRLSMQGHSGLDSYYFYCTKYRLVYTTKSVPAVAVDRDSTVQTPDAPSSLCTALIVIGSTAVEIIR